MIEVHAIAAYDIFNGIAKNGTIPWHIPEDMRFFKNVTSKNVVIMGRNTFASLNYEPLKDRLNIVITMSPEKLLKYCDNYSNVIFTDNKNIHLDIIRNSNEYANRYYFLNKHFKIFYIGGEQIYKKFIPICSTIWITKVKFDYDCDLFFSTELDNNVEYKSNLITETPIYDIIKYTRIVDC